MCLKCLTAMLLFQQNSVLPELICKCYQLQGEWRSIQKDTQLPVQMMLSAYICAVSYREVLLLLSLQLPIGIGSRFFGVWWGLGPVKNSVSLYSTRGMNNMFGLRSGLFTCWIQTVNPCILHGKICISYISLLISLFIHRCLSVNNIISTLTFQRGKQSWGFQ